MKHRQAEHEDGIPIFKSCSYTDYTGAVSALNARQIPYRAAEVNEGGWRVPRPCHWLFVDAKHEDKARNAIASIPSEVIPVGGEESPSRRRRIATAIYLAIIAVAFVAAIVLALTR